MNNLTQKMLELLENDIFYLEKKYSSHHYFPDFIKSNLLQYLECLNNSDFWKEFIAIHYPNNPETPWEMFFEMIEKFCSKINESIENYYSGRISAAYANLSEGLAAILWKTSSLFEDGITKVDVGKLQLYRIRRKKEYCEFTKGDMFHIPFEKREIVSTQKYSIPGHPCLYLGDSIYVCWEELNQPVIREVFACKFVNAERISLIEILKTEDFKKRILSKEGPELSSEIFRFILLYPLIITCSVRTKNRNGIFKPEYIIPQLFLQFVIEHKDKIDGIKYFSTIINSERIENIEIYNYVFPSRTTNKKSGYCDALIDKFKLTEPLLWEYEEIGTNNVTFFGSSPRDNINIELTKGRKLPYDWTTFRAIEQVLSYETMVLSKLNIL